MGVVGGALVTGGWAQTQYTITQLDSLPASQHPSSNNLGQIVANRPNNGRMTPFLWQQSFGLTYLTFAPYLTGSVSTINDSGQMAGSVGMSVGFTTTPALWSSPTSYVTLPLLPGSTIGEAVTINEAGVVGGSSRDANSIYWPVLWINGAIIQMAGPGNTICIDINDSGQAVGLSAPFSLEESVYWTNPGTCLPMGTLPTYSRTSVVQINNAGVAVGTCYDGSNRYVGFRYTPETGLVPVTGLPGFQNTRIVAINNSGYMLGWSSSPFVRSKPTIWTPAGEPIDFYSLLPASGSRFHFTSMSDFTDNNTIIGIGLGNGIGYLLVATPNASRGKA